MMRSEIVLEIGIEAEKVEWRQMMNRNKTVIFSTIGISLFLLFTATDAFSYSHRFIQSSRSSAISHVLVSNSIEGEYGHIEASLDESGDLPVSERKYWQGYNYRMAIGLELMKFIQFTTGHTFVNLKQRGGTLESLSGSRVHGDVRFVFSSPLGNLELGLGLTGAKLDYQKELESATLYGSGLYTSLGVNYYLSNALSIFGQVKSISEHLSKNSGPTRLNQMDSSTSNAGLGFRLWL